jgi:hypothetical protein
VRRTILVWAGLLLVYVLFRSWYDGGGGPLGADEVQRYVALFEERGAEPAQLEALREFLAGDTGSDFVMANFIHFREGPDAQRDLERYMAFMFPQMLQRACHPVLMGPAVARALDLWGIEDGDRWSLVGLVRYRSRRDLVEIATHPAFADAHRYKAAAIEQTIAVPIEPSLQLGSPRWWVGGALVALGALLQLALRRRAA